MHDRGAPHVKALSAGRLQQRLATSLSRENRGFLVVVNRINDNPEDWGWTIVRRNPPIGAKIVETGFGSYSAASSAGRVALKEFLERLSVEEKNRT